MDICLIMHINKETIAVDISIKFEEKRIEQSFGKLPDIQQIINSSRPIF